MTARELAHGLRSVRQTHDVAALRALAFRAYAVSSQREDDASETLIWAIATKIARLERLN